MSTTYEVPPGKHEFMGTIGGGVAYLAADVIENHIYYVFIEPEGITGFLFQPLRAKTPEKWVDY